MDKSERIPSPCIDVCEDLHKRCIACGRSKREKKAWKKADGREEKLMMLRQALDATAAIGTQQLWIREYRRKCMKKGVDCPLDDLLTDTPEG